MTETSARLGFVRSSAAVLIGIVLAVVVLLALAIGSTYLLLGGSGSPAEHHNPSFRFGEKVMRTQIYGGFVGGPSSIAGQCRYRIIRASNWTSDLNVIEAIAGCKYEEWALDN